MKVRDSCLGSILCPQSWFCLTRAAGSPCRSGLRAAISRLVDVALTRLVWRLQHADPGQDHGSDGPKITRGRKKKNPRRSASRPAVSLSSMKPAESIDLSADDLRRPRIGPSASCSISIRNRRPVTDSSSPHLHARLSDQLRIDRARMLHSGPSSR